MPNDVLTQMATTGYGPVTLRDAGDGTFTATAAGRRVVVAGDDAALHFATGVTVPWPDGGDDGRGYDPIAMALEELAHTHRPELVTIEGAPGSELTVNLWIPVGGATPAAVAVAVYSTARIATLACSTVADHVALLEMAALAMVEEEAPAPVAVAVAATAPAPEPAPPPPESPPLAPESPPPAPESVPPPPPPEV